MDTRRATIEEFEAAVRSGVIDPAQARRLYALGLANADLSVLGEAVARERKRVSEIYRLVRSYRCPDSMAEELVTAQASAAEAEKIIRQRTSCCRT